MRSWLLPLLLGLACGTVSAWGVGGGTLLLLVMTLLLGVDARTAQCVNLLFFLPTAASALYLHGKGGFLHSPPPSSAPPWGPSSPPPSPRTPSASPLASTSWPPPRRC